jgi:hypothetical protein
MSNPYGSHELKLQKAAEFIKAGHKNEARQLLRDILVADQNNLAAWELLAYAANNIQEETYCLNRILKLRPDHPWAKQRLVCPAAYPFRRDPRRRRNQGNGAGNLLLYSWGFSFLGEFS